MNIAAIFDPSTSTSDAFTVPQSSANGKMVVYNESNISLQFSFQSGATAYVPAWTALLFHGPFGSVNVSWEHQTILTGAGNAPLSQVVVETYACNEPVPGTYPAPLVRQTNIGNSVPLSTSATSISNDGNSANTSVVEATVSGDSGSAVSITNNGVVAIGTTANKGSITLKGTLSTDNGSLTTDGTGILSAVAFEPTGAASKPKISGDSSGNINIDVPNGTRIVQVNSGGLDLTTSGTFDITAGEMHATNGFKFSNSQTMSKISTFSGAGSGTYNHNLGGTPAIVLPMCNVSGSQTMGYDSANSTQVHITSGGGLSFKAFCWN
jgi:hypothetical protein